MPCQVGGAQQFVKSQLTCLSSEEPVNLYELHVQQSNREIVHLYELHVQQSNREIVHLYELHVQ
jgi:hypothetical protein